MILLTGAYGEEVGRHKIKFHWFKILEIMEYNTISLTYNLFLLLPHP